MTTKDTPSADVAARPRATPLADNARVGIAMLWHAYACAQDAGADPWDFALEIATLYAAGMTISDLRWLVAKRFAEHGQESSAYGDPHRSFRPGAGYFFEPTTCVVLTSDGAAFAGHCSKAWMISSQPTPPGETASFASGHTAAPENEPPPAHHRNGSRPAAVKPCWNPSRRELSLDGLIVKRFRVPARIQELILSAFEEDGWPRHIDDPLPGSGDIDSRTRLHDTIHRLNGHQTHRLIRFAGNGNGTGISWERRPPIVAR